MNVRTTLIFVAFCWTFLSAPAGHAQFYEKVVDFADARAADIANSPNRGGRPEGELIQGSDGNFYGTASSGGINVGLGYGTIFRMTPAGALTTFVEFTGNGASNKGSYPTAGLVQGGDGNFYGTSSSGGANNLGTVFRVTPAGVLTTLVEFTGNGASNRGSYPGRLVQTSDGNFYGTTGSGGASDLGTIFRVTPAGALTTLVEFTGNGAFNKGSFPGRLVLANDGNLHGTTSEGGVNDFGTVFRMTPAGVLTTLVEFTDFSGAIRGRRPDGLIQASDGNFYGTTKAGGATGFGTIFRMTPAGALTTLVEFINQGSANRGSSPLGLVQASDGNFYGTTTSGGLSDGFQGYGTVFRMTPAGVLTTLVEFTGNGASNKGSEPAAGLLQGSDGSFYGTTRSGGANGIGTVFRMTSTGVLTTLVEFTGLSQSNLGRYLPARLAQDNDGSFYGTTNAGGANDAGTVFRMSPAEIVTTLVEFTNNGAANKGSSPTAGLVKASDGNLYGTTGGGGANFSGTVFRMTSAGVLTTLVEFSDNGASNKGAFPNELLQGSDGNFYGTTQSGGANGLGTVFRMTSTGALTTLVQFTGNGGLQKGSAPSAALIQASDGNFYGTTQGGGVNGLGTVFRMTSAGALTTLVEFTGNGLANKGRNPIAQLMQVSNGNIYGTTLGGGANDLGTVFRMTTAGALTTLVEFTGDGASNRGRRPFVGLVEGADSNLYGATFTGGANNFGTVFRMTPAGVLTTLKEFTSVGEGYPWGKLIVAADGNLYGTTTSDGASSTNAKGGTIYRLVTPGAPTALVRRVVREGGNVVVEAQVNPRGSSTNVTLEYGTNGTAFPNAVPLGVGLNGFQTRLVGTTLTGLAPGTTYFLRVRATSSAGTRVTSVESFLTLAQPVVTVSAASEVAPTSARFNGSVNARNFDTTALFEWGTDGNSFPNVVSVEQGTITGNTAVPVSKAVAGLPAGGTVHYRIRATNEAGTVISGARSFSTVGATTSNPLPEQVGVTEAIFRATINTFGQTASVKFKFWANTTPGTVLETEPQTVTSNGPTEVSARETRLEENVTYSYRVSVELAGTETDGGVVMFTTDTNVAPLAVNDLIFYNGQEAVEVLANDTDPNDGTNANLLLDLTLVVPPNAAQGVASVLADRRSISYNPQFNLLDDDALTYRVRDRLGASADGQVRLVAFRKRAGSYGGKVTIGARELRVQVDVTASGEISTSFLNWAGESFQVKGVFDQRGNITRAFQFDPTDTGSPRLGLKLDLNPDLPQIDGRFEETDNGTSTTGGEVAFTLMKNSGSGGLAASGLRTGFLSPPPELAATMTHGYLRMTIGKDARRGARFAGRLPDGEPFLASARPQGRVYELTAKLEQGGILTGLVRMVDGSDGAGGMIGSFAWKKKASSRARFERGGVETLISLSGVAYPELDRGALPAIGLGPATPNARLRVSGAGLPAYRDLLLNVLPGQVRPQIIGPDPAQTGPDLPLNQLKLKVDGARARFSGQLPHPTTGKPVPFDGAFRLPLNDGALPGTDDLQSAQGRGTFRGSEGAATVQMVPACLN